jgi:crotonobetainyl-CoA:carnitine CoA-transferase CaiB-like acyl-CoA transferase
LQQWKREFLSHDADDAFSTGAVHADQVIGSWIAQLSLEEVLGAMKTARVPAGPILSTADIVAEEQYQQRGMFHQARPPSGEAAGVSRFQLPIVAVLYASFQSAPVSLA